MYIISIVNRKLFFFGFVFPFIFNLAKIIFIQLHGTFVSFLFDLPLQKVEPGPGVDDPLATDDLLRVLLLELILLTVMAHIAPHLRLPVEMNLPGALHVHQFLPLCHLLNPLAWVFVPLVRAGRPFDAQGSCVRQAS